MYSAQFRTPFTLTCAGPSQSGKTSWTHEFLRHATLLVDRPIRHVMYHYHEWQPMFDQMEAEGLVHEFVQGTPTMESIRQRAADMKDVNGYSGILIIIDDFGTEITKDMRDLVAVGVHHLRIAGLFFLQQNLFSKTPFNRDLTISSQYMVFFNCPRDKLMITNFARQFAPGNGRYIVDAYHKIMETPYNTMLVDLHQKTPNHIRIRSNIFPHQAPMIVWMPSIGACKK